MDRLTRKVLCGVNRTVGRWLPPRLLSRDIPGIPGRVHVDDQMYRSDAPEHVGHYVEDAQSAVENIQASLAGAGRSLDDVEACLDFACGYGRVARWLARALAPERITVADVDQQAVRFCAREFGAQPLFASPDVGKTVCPTRYDLVFVGSLLTHLDLLACGAALENLTGALCPGGVLIFSTQGVGCLDHLDWYGPEFVAAAAEYRATCAADGAHFRPYRGKRAYGITIHTRAYIEALMSVQFGGRLRLVRLAERGWDRHQDVWAYQRIG